jgi:hypothetical protein
MNKNQFLISLVFVSVFSFLGGIVGGVITGGANIFAKDDASSQNNKKIDFLEAEYISVDSMIAKYMFIEGDEGKGVVELSTKNGDPFLNFYSKQNHLLSGKGPTFALWIGKDGAPKMLFMDKDLDKRIQLRVDGMDPEMSMLYNSKTRLRLGTNSLYTKKTGIEEKVKGSVCAFDNNGGLIGRLPYE